MTICESMREYGFQEDEFTDWLEFYIDLCMADLGVQEKPYVLQLLLEELKPLADIPEALDFYTDTVKDAVEELLTDWGLVEEDDYNEFVDWYTIHSLSKVRTGGVRCLERSET